MFKRFPQLKWFIGLTAVLVMTWGGLKIWRIGTHAYSLYNTLNTVQAMAAAPEKYIAQDLGLTQLQPLVQQTHLDLKALQKETALFNPLLRNLGWVPNVGKDIQAMPDLLAMGVALSQAGDLLTTAMVPTLQDLLADQDQSSQSIKEKIPLLVESLAQNDAAFAQAHRSVVEARFHRQQIQVDALSPRLAGPLTKLDKGLPLLDLALQLAPFSASSLGNDAPKTYLIVAQNDDEIRATGGFLTAVGTLTLDKGEIKALTFEDSYAIDDFKKHYPDAPPQLRRYMLAYIWLFRDANWSPDFPTSVQAMLDLYAISRDTKIDGVIAIDQVALERVIAAFEPISVESWEEPVTSKNIKRLIQESLSLGESESQKLGPWWRNRKNFVTDLANALRNRLEANPEGVDWPELIQTSLDLLEERHIQIWMANPILQTWLEDRHWAGRILPASADYLLVVDSNIGFNKVNAKVTKTIDYQVNLTTPESPTATLTLTYHNQSQGNDPCLHKPRYGENYDDIINRCYWNYLRLYRPLESQLLEATPYSLEAEFLLDGQAEPAKVDELPPEQDKSNFGALLMVPRGQTKEITFQHQLPPDTLIQTEVGWRYHLLVQKQAGTKADKINLEINLPPQADLIQSNYQPDQIKENGVLVYHLSLKTDLALEIVFNSSK